MLTAIGMLAGMTGCDGGTPSQGDVLYKSENIRITFDETAFGASYVLSLNVENLSSKEITIESASAYVNGRYFSAK